jgi:hypothetical protein
MKNPHKALEAIEYLVGGDFGIEMECYTYEMFETGKKWNKTQLKKNLRDAAKLITTIYQISHAEISTCNHTDWQKIKNNLLVEKAKND